MGNTTAAALSGDARSRVAAIVGDSCLPPNHPAWPQLFSSVLAQPLYLDAPHLMHSALDPLCNDLCTVNPAPAHAFRRWWLTCACVCVYSDQQPSHAQPEHVAMACSASFVTCTVVRSARGGGRHRERDVPGAEVRAPFRHELRSRCPRRPASCCRDVDATRSAISGVSTHQPATAAATADSWRCRWTGSSCSSPTCCRGQHRSKVATNASTDAGECCRHGKLHKRAAGVLQ